MGLHTSNQTLKVKGLQSAYMAILLALLGPKVWPLCKSLDSLRMKTQILVKRPNFFFNKILKI